MKIVQLTKVNSDTVEMLRRLLEKAESGELQNIVYCADCTGGHIDTGYTQITDRIVTIGMIERLKFQLLADMMIESVPIEITE